jgi:diaminopimelate epimerase
MTFYKYQGTGNDFILFDNRDGRISLSGAQIALLCNRRFGIGADGLMLLEQAAGYDFKMVYYNSDGGESTMCGNGGRCLAAFAKNLGIIDTQANFVAIDGPHTATIGADGLISLHMNDVPDMEIQEFHTILNTGSPHYVLWVPDVKNASVFTAGRKIRNQPEFQPDGINVNFVQLVNGKLSVRTYERGVEDETLSCGTGVTAAAIAATAKFMGEFNTEIETPGGKLEVSFTKNTPTSATDVVLTGPAEFVFKGEVSDRLIG